MATSSRQSQSSRAKPRLRTVAPAPAARDEKEALDLVMELMAIPGVSGQEGQVVDRITRKLCGAGAEATAIETDQAHRQSPLDGEVGNLIFKLPGTLRAPRRMLMAHLDTVPVCLGSKPVRKRQFIESADKATGLGADDRAGAAAVLMAALTILRRQLPHPPLTFFWPVQEEVGLFGARHARLSRLGRPRFAFNWDGGSASKLTVGATGAFRLTITIHGLASHAGGAPEQGVSAIAIASLAIARIVRDGWHGEIIKGKRRGTSNIGIIQGGLATNVVADRVEIEAEARSHDARFRVEIVNALESAFEAAAREVRSADGRSGSVEVDRRFDYESFRLADNEPCVLAAEEAVRATGGKPVRAVTNGGLDANWLSARGIPTVTLGCGQLNVHTISERLDIAEFQRACRVALHVATAGASRDL